MLVFTALDAQVYWDERGFPEIQAPHPLVIFGVKPQAGHIAHDWIVNMGPDNEIVPWYKCILPPEASDLIGSRILYRPNPSEDPGRHVRLSLPLREMDGAHMSWLIDEYGNQDPDYRELTDRYKRSRDRLPPPKKFYLGELPPIISIDNP